MKTIDKVRKYGILLFVAAGLVAFGVEALKTVPEYEGKGDGFYDDITVKIAAEKNRKGEVRVSKIEVIHEDTPAVAGPAIENLKQQLMEKQDPTKLDEVAGATFTSAGVIEAIEDAYSKVK